MSKFLASNGNYKTRGLFYEAAMEITGTAPDAIYTLNCHKSEQAGLPCAHCLYMETEDPTEHTFGTKYFASWKHFQLIAKTPWMRKYLDSWREEMEVMLAAKGVRKQIELTEKGNQSAGKFLAERGWKQKRRAGGPSKAEKERELKIETRLEKELSDDFERVFGSKAH